MPITSQQDRVLALISAGSSIADAAQSVGIHRNTIHNWLRAQPSFRLALAAAREVKAVYWRDQAEQHAAAALDAILALLADPLAPASVRLKAAQTILELAVAPPPDPVSDSLDSPPPAPEREETPLAAAVPSAADPAAGAQTLKSVHKVAQSPKPGRNDLCPCGSGRKYKRCCLHRPALPEPNAA